MEAPDNSINEGKKKRRVETDLRKISSNLKSLIDSDEWKKREKLEPFPRNTHGFGFEDKFGSRIGINVERRDGLAKQIIVTKRRPDANGTLVQTGQWGIYFADAQDRKSAIMEGKYSGSYATDEQKVLNLQHKEAKSIEIEDISLSNWSLGDTKKTKMTVWAVEKYSNGRPPETLKINIPDFTVEDAVSKLGRLAEDLKTEFKIMTASGSQV